MNKKLTVSLATATLLLLAACGQQTDSTKTSSNSHSTTQSEKRAKKQSESKLRAQSSAKEQASEASAKAMSESREKAALAASTASAQAAEAASSASASEQAAAVSSASASAMAASKASESQQAAEQAKQSAIKPITQAEAIEAEKKAFEGAEVIVSHNGTFSSQPDGSMTAHDYSGAQGEDFWTFTPNADGTITVLSKFGSVKGGEQQIETHVVPR
ncbi:hypothetical protein ACEN4A_02660 [Latilactobacillus sakei]|uniref:hypothetical protein n=1 Tax=Latilactobacillus sakei TaxID=1599 RepID=UPI000DC64416|nr:hypothetical protein [Latilactobacillus sakei]SPS07268.1 hypothetical protein LAS9624_01518 [Latilactobacillus sakei]